MKQLKFLLIAPTMMLLFFACNSGNNEATTETTGTDSTMTATDTTGTEQTQPEAPAKPALTVLIKHKVSNFDKWLVAYESHDSTRLAFGLHNFVVGRGTNDSNMVLVALRADDSTKAKEFAKLPGLKDAMKKGGVMGTPSFMYTENDWHDDAGSDAKTDRVIINQKIKDWDAWKKAFDSHKQARTDAGLTDRAVSHAWGDPHVVSVVLYVSDMKKADGFIKSKDLKDKMAEAGVVGAPDIFFYHVVKEW
jgi:hypothetical protein